MKISAERQCVLALFLLFQPDMKIVESRTIVGKIQNYLVTL